MATGLVIRNDPRVVVAERTNIRYFTLAELGEKVDIITMDVSFISTTIIFPVLQTLLQDNGEIVSLIKPQFEAGREKVGKNGVVKNPLVHREVLLRCIAAAREVGLSCVGITYSPITGPKGNIEYFIHLRLNAEPLPDLESRAASVVSEAHRVLEDRAGEDSSSKQ